MTTEIIEILIPGPQGPAVADNAITNARLADMGPGTLKGRVSAGTGDPEDLTAAQTRGLLGLAAIAVSGSAADLGAGTLSDARLSANVARRDQANAFSAAASFAGITVGRGGGGHADSTALGRAALASATQAATANTAVGAAALFALTGAEGNVALGAFAGTSVTSGTYNVLAGTYAGAALTTGSNNVFAGPAAGASATTGSQNAGLGHAAHYLGMADSQCSALGALANFAGGYANATCLGFDSAVTGANQVQLGDSRTTVYAYGAVQNRSDARDKADVRDTALGLAFVRALRPVDFRWDLREDYRPGKPGPGASPDAFGAWRAASRIGAIVKDGSAKRARFHSGLIAQEVAAAVEAAGFDTRGWGAVQDHGHSGGEDVMSLGYGQFVAPLIKAVQELSQRVEALEAERT